MKDWIIWGLAGLSAITGLGLIGQTVRNRRLRKKLEDNNIDPDSNVNKHIAPQPQS